MMAMTGKHHTQLHIVQSSPFNSQFDGNDRIVLGDSSRPLETLIFANIIVDGGKGNRDVLMIRDQGSSTSKPIAVRPTMLTGIHGSGSETISYFDIENINMALGKAAAQVNVYSTARDASITLTTQCKWHISSVLQALLLRMNGNQNHSHLFTLKMFVAGDDDINIRNGKSESEHRCSKDLHISIIN